MKIGIIGTGAIGGTIAKKIKYCWARSKSK